MSSEAAPRPRRIILIEPSAARGVLAGALARPDFELVDAFDSNDFFHHLHRTRIDLLIVDAASPTIQLPAFLREVRRRLGPQRCLPLIVVGGNEQDDDYEAVCEFGTADVLRKPIHTGELALRVHIMLRTKECYDRWTEADAAARRQRDVVTTSLKRLSPNHLPEVAGWRFAQYQKACGRNAGDFFDCFPLDGGRVGLAIADVLGYGIRVLPPVAMAQGVLRCNLAEGSTPSEILSQINGVHLDLATAGELVSVYAAVIDTETGQLIHSTAGGQPPLLQVPGHEPRWLQVPGGPPIGTDLEVIYEDAEEMLPPGARLWLATNGAWEACESNGQRSGFEEFSRLVTETVRLSLGEAVASIEAQITEHLSGKEPNDDITMLVVERLEI